MRWRMGYIYCALWLRWRRSGLSSELRYQLLHRRVRSGGRQSRGRRAAHAHRASPRARGGPQRSSPRATSMYVYVGNVPYT